MSDEKMLSIGDDWNVRKERFMLSLYDMIEQKDKLKDEGIDDDEIRKQKLDMIERIIDSSTEDTLAREIPRIRQAIRTQFEDLVKIALKALTAQTDDERAEMLETLKELKEQSKKLPKPE